MKYILSILCFCFLCYSCASSNSSKEGPSGDVQAGSGAMQPTAADETSETIEPRSPTGKVKFLYITNDAFHTVSKINLDSFSLVKNIATGKTPDYLAVSDDGNFVVVNDREGKYLTFIDTKNDSTKNVPLSVTNITDIKISKASDTIFILSSDKQLEVIHLDENLAISSQEVIALATNPQKIEAANNFVVLFGSSDTTLLFFNPASPAAINEASICNTVTAAKFYTDDTYIFIVCGQEFVIFDLANKITRASETLSFVPKDVTMNSAHTTIYMASATPDTDNLIIRNYTSLEDPITSSETRASVSELSKVEMLFYHEGEQDTTPKLLILGTTELVTFDLSTNQLASRYSLTKDPLKIHDYKDALFVTHANPLGLLTKINALNSSMNTLEGFALEGWFER